MSAAPVSSAPVQPQAAFPPLEAVIKEADDIIGTCMNMTGDDILRTIVLPEMEEPAHAVMTEILFPSIESGIESNLGALINEVWKELPQMVSASIDRALGNAGRVVLPQLARNEYTCSLPCNCEPGCPGVTDNQCEDNQDNGDDDEC